MPITFCIERARQAQLLTLRRALPGSGSSRAATFRPPQGRGALTRVAGEFRLRALLGLFVSGLNAAKKCALIERSCKSVGRKCVTETHMFRVRRMFLTR